MKGDTEALAHPISRSKVKPKAKAKPFKFLPALKRTTFFQPNTQQQNSQRRT